MEREHVPERLSRVGERVKQAREALRGARQDLERLRLAADDPLLIQYRRAAEPLLDLNQAVWERLQKEAPDHLLADLAPREIGRVRSARREMLG